MGSVLRTKLVVVGDWSVGKTALVQQFLNSGTAFPKNYTMTLGGEVLTKLVHIPDTTDSVELLILDCSGREVLFPGYTMIPPYTQVYTDMLAPAWAGASMVLAVFDCTREETVAKAKEWVGRVRGSGPALPGVFLAAKADLGDRRVVAPKAGAEAAASLGLQYFESSSKDHTGVEEPFFYLANEWHKLHGEQALAMAEVA